MRSVTLYLAMSLDGYIARTDGAVDWLGGEDPKDPGNSYETFLKGIDTVLMGANTYRQITQDLSPDCWPYAGLSCYVFTHKTLPSPQPPDCQPVATTPAALLAILKQRPGRDIWLCGGAHLIRQFQRADLIDRYWITLIPSVLGEGIPLFPADGRECPLHLEGTHIYNGMVDLIYTRRNTLQR